MIATIINAIAIILGTALGIAFKDFLGRRARAWERIQAIIYNAVGLVTLMLGILTVIQTQRILYFALAIVFGAIIGEIVGIERRILRIGERMRGWIFLKRSSHSFARAFLDASVLYCVGSLAIVGSIQASIQGDYSLLLTKSLLDGTISLLLATTLGVGVGFSALTVLVYQGSLHLTANLLAGYVNDLVLSELSAVGGAMIILIGLSLLGVKKFPTGNFLPALIIVLIFVALDPYLPAVFSL